MEFDYSLLRGKIKEKYGTFQSFAKVLEVSPAQMSYLLTNKAKWDNDLIVKAAGLLDILDNITEYFFTVKSHKSEMKKGDAQ